ncbi:MAG: hypothetical protein ABR860_09645 [Terracidiphilus sp.]|jgi:uncharacterized protein (DUF983 family)
MFNALPSVVQLDISILFTALAWGLGFYLADRRAYVFASLSIGCIVCLAGYTVASLNTPAWAVVPSLIPLDLLLSWYVLRKPRKIAVAYVSTWCIYLVFHIGLSAFFRYDSLIPSWKLHA